MTAPARPSEPDLREALARHFEPSAFQPAHYDGMRFWASYRDIAYEKADKLIAGPLATLTTDLAEQKARIAVLEARLKPFAAEADRYDPDEGDGHLHPWDVPANYTVDHLRSARAALSQGEPNADTN